jgi:Uma2 family endonuclease
MLETVPMTRAHARDAAAETVPVRRRFTIDEYHRMGEAGIFHEDDRVELLDGEIVEMSPIGSRHAGIVDRLTMLFARRLGRHAIVRVQNPIVLDDYSEPQPDLTLLRPRTDYYVGSHPRPTDVLLAIEVMDASASYERSLKLPLYARKHVRELWLVDLPAAAVDVYRRPASSGYREHQRLARGRRIAPLAFPRVHFRVADVLG